MATGLSIRWFAPNAHSRSIIPALAARGVRAIESDAEPADLAIAMGDTVAEDAWRWSAFHGRPLILYIWELPPWSIGKGHFNRV
ncbi:MAG TPA: hypothetical protein VMJ30_09610, partial [Gemmatimonadales bacterium]|nr:hypothetical protein [Gemmatimonadales bacterium]